MRIRAAVLNQTNQPFAIETVELEEPKAGEVLIKLAACGVCHSDYHLATGDTQHPLPAVAGHEGAGVVAAVGAGVTHVSPGDHVILSWAPDCGNCYFCQIGKPNLCDTYTSPLWAGTMLDGTPRLRKLDGSRSTTIAEPHRLPTTPWCPHRAAFRLTRSCRLKPLR